MAFNLLAITNEDGKSAGVLQESGGVHFSVAGLPGLAGDPTQSQLEAHILREIKIAMQRAIDTAQP